MAQWTFDVKFSYGTQTIFRSLTFVTREDGNLKMPLPEPTSEDLALALLSASGGSCSGLDIDVGSYIHTVKIVRDISVVTFIIGPLIGASSSSLSISTPDSDSSDDYPEIGANAYGEPMEDGRLIFMVALNGDRSNTSRRYPTIRRSEPFNPRSTE
jgi:hypothetical protein